MDNALIHTNKHLEGRGYGCIYLPSYSPELNPIEQFWSVFKSKLKRETLIDEETLITEYFKASTGIMFHDFLEHNSGNSVYIYRIS